MSDRTKVTVGSGGIFRLFCLMLRKFSHLRITIEWSDKVEGTSTVEQL
ncbi:18373_t:CDS:2 [Funneliformis geosporum]|uniref:18373_t:CDS:1 n=1 Tax=Funneliformis geosporum TaxID=1117311 RepID=A0A9W4SJJ1_9GLOM|nr:18373_t:CDS:2 [Funneliformis geosporum]